MTYSPHLLGLIVSIGLVACNGDTAPRPEAPASPARASAPVSSPARPAPVLVTEARPATEREAEAPLDPAGVLDEQERWLLQADDEALTREQRVARAHAQRKLVMADPDHPLRPTLEKIDRTVESGEYAQRSRDVWMGHTPITKPEGLDDHPSSPLGG